MPGRFRARMHPALRSLPGRMNPALRSLPGRMHPALRSLPGRMQRRCRGRARASSRRAEYHAFADQPGDAGLDEFEAEQMLEQFRRTGDGLVLTCSEPEANGIRALG